MKAQILFAALLIPFFASAQSMDVSEEVQKSKWEVQDGQADIEGESSATAGDAKKAWQKACADWKKEMKEDNKENKIINLNCGTAACSGEVGSKVCTSKGTYKLKTKNE
jgi:hypothetical protein